MSQHPIRRSRVIGTYLVAVVVSIVVGVITGPLFDPMPFWLQYLVSIPIAIAIIAGTFRVLRPWYRPAPKVAQWTEDRL